MRPRIVALGDSLTSGHGIGADAAFPAILQQRIDAEGFDYTMVNAGVSRDTTAQAVQRLERALDGDVRILIVALGANDGIRGVPIDQIARNLRQTIETARARRIDVVLCAMEALPLYGWPYATAFHNIYVNLANEFRLPLVPFVMMHLLGNASMMLPDRVHPNASGARVIAGVIWPHLQPLLKRVRVQR